MYNPLFLPWVEWPGGRNGSDLVYSLRFGHSTLCRYKNVHREKVLKRVFEGLIELSGK